MGVVLCSGFNHALPFLWYLTKGVSLLIDDETKIETSKNFVPGYKDLR